MNPKIIKLKAERAKNDEKIAALRSRNRELDESIVELENTDIIGLARATGMSMEELAQFLTQLKRGARPLSHPVPRRIRTMCMKMNNNRLLRGVAAILCLALMFLTMSGMAMATDMEDAPAGGAPESTSEIMEAELPATPEETPDTQEPAPAPPETTETPQPEAEYALDADIPAGWHNAPVTVTVRIRDKNNAGWQKVEAALRETAERTDLTEQLAHNGLARYTVPDNGTVFIFITDPFGAEHKKELTVSCMDFEAPRLRAGVSGTLLRVEAADTLSGIAGVYVNDELYTTLQNGEFSVRIDKTRGIPTFTSWAWTTRATARAMW